MPPLSPLGNGGSNTEAEVSGDHLSASGDTANSKASVLMAH